VKPRFLIATSLLIGSYIAVVVPFTAYLENKPIEEKMGYIPHAEVLRLLSADQREFVAATLIMKTISYYGGLVEKAPRDMSRTVDYPGMYHAMETAVRLDPYNMDAYYFSQAILVWDAGQVKLVNDLLRYGMNYRTWDFYLPYFAGFNSAYFLKDYAEAAEYYRRVGELTGDSLSMSLAGRYLYESGRTDLALSYLSMMVKGAHNEAIRKTLSDRLRAFQEVRMIEMARDQFARERKRRPENIKELLDRHYLKEVPKDPYGGTFYLDEEGRVRSTSKFSYGVAAK
jgi:tetratricopeptide (TPR) repeat protein